MFPRRKRLARGHFKELTGRRLSSPHFAVAIPRHGEGYAVVIGKGAARLSTARHELKRRVLTILRGLPLPPALVIFPKASAARLTYDELRVELASLVEKISAVK